MQLQDIQKTFATSIFFRFILTHGIMGYHFFMTKQTDAYIWSGEYLMPTSAASLS